MDIGASFTKDLIEPVDQFFELPDRQQTSFGPAVSAKAKLRGQHGDIAAEDLEIGDMLYTRDHGLRPVRDIIEIRPRRGLDEVITLMPNSLGNDGELVVALDCGVLFSSWRVECLFDTFEVLAPAKGLINDQTIKKTRNAPSKMVQIVMDNHEIIFAENLPVETLHPALNRKGNMKLAKNAKDVIGSQARIRINAVDARDLAPDA